MEIKLEKNVPIPLAGKFKNSSKYPWKNMKKGDSFYVVKPKHRDYNSFRAQIQSCGRTYIKWHNKNWKFQTLKEKLGIRIWRVK